MRGDASRYWPERLVPTMDVPQTSLSFNLATTAQRFPDRPACIADGVVLTYRDLALQVERLAAHLRLHCGVAPGDRVLLFTQNSPQFVIAYYAILRVDAIVVPVNPMNKTGELEHYASDSGACGVIATRDVWPHAEPLVQRGLLCWAVLGCYDDVLSLGASAPNQSGFSSKTSITDWVDAVRHDNVAPPSRALPSDLALMVYTSGTTGVPKGCLHTHQSIASGILNSVCWHGLNHTGVVLATVPMFHVTGMQTNMNVPIYLGATVVILRRWNAAAAVQLIRQHDVTEWTAISTMITDVLSLPDLPPHALSSLRYLRGGGAPMPEAVARRFDESFGIRYLEGYGLSETIAAVLFNPPSNPKRQCAGIPMVNVDARVVEPQGTAELAIGQVGEIIVSGDQVFSGYWKQPAADTDAFIQIDGRRFLRTGDLGYIDEDGYFHVVDRIKRMINASGFKVWPNEVENMLYRHPAVQEACVIASHDPHRGETVKAVIVLRREHRDSVTKDDLIHWARGEMAAYKVPRLIEFRDALPRSSSGKVLWRELQDQELSATALSGARQRRHETP
ncbi:MAG: long-chain-fatty-acid--CoA ligase [Pseudomonadota bacterium]|nr:long-chain-fatty-acid--CoA ligase [Pseudomonadota bacterium]